MSETNHYALVADIGGTHARFSRVDLANLAVDQIMVYRCTDFANLDAALIFYQKNHGLSGLKHAAIAIACPILNDLVKMTNFHWQFSIAAIKQQLGFLNLHVLNDFTAIAMSLPGLASHEKIQIGHGQVDTLKPCVVLGAGSGLGIAHLIPTANSFISLASEGSHVDWATLTPQEQFIHAFLVKRYGHVSPERLLSGPGLENIYLALSEYYKKDRAPLKAEEITNLALNNQCELASAVVDQFFASLGSYAGDLALILNAFGGVYIAGGIVPKLLPLIEKSKFRQRFEAKGRFNSFNSQIPTYVITAEQPGLLGAAIYLKHRLLDNKS